MIQPRTLWSIMVVLVFANLACSLPFITQSANDSVNDESGEMPAQQPSLAGIVQLTDTPVQGPTTAVDPTQQSVPVVENPNNPVYILLAMTGVTHNSDWTPHVERFNGVEMALVPAGCFQMGSEDGASDESPMHEVCFDKPFWIDVYEVTNAQYGGASPACTGMPTEHEEEPRVCVSWADSLAHCEARGARLPTEAEWEYATRGPDNLIYPWGNTFVADNVVYSENYPEQHVESIGNKPGGVSWVGAYDLSGNVREWVSDWYTEGYYATLSDGVVNPIGPESGDAHVMRGGSWGDSEFNLRAASRHGANPVEGGINIIGFRCARSYNP